MIMKILYLFLFASVLYGCTIDEELKPTYANDLIGIKLDNAIISSYAEDKNSYYYFAYADSAALVANQPFDSCTYAVHSFSFSPEHIQKGVWIRAKQFADKSVYETNAICYQANVTKNIRYVNIDKNINFIVTKRAPKYAICGISITFSENKDADLITGPVSDLYLTLDGKLITPKNDHIDDLYPQFVFKEPIQIENNNRSLAFYDNNFGVVPDVLLDEVKLDFSTFQTDSWDRSEGCSFKYPVQYYCYSPSISFMIICKKY